MQDLNDLIPASGWTLEMATAINDVGQIVGYGVSPSGQMNAFSFLLTPAPEPSTLVLLRYRPIGSVAYVWRRRTA